MRVENIRKDEVHVRFDLGRKFARAYYRDEMKAKGLNPDYNLSIDNDYSKRNPKYYNDESAVNKFLGFSNSSNEDKSIQILLKINGKMILNLWVIGTSYCHIKTIQS